MELNQTFDQIKAGPLHIKTAYDFIKSLYEGSVRDYWNMIADVDQMAHFVAYENIRNHQMNDFEDFSDYLTMIREGQQEYFAPVKENPGIASMARYAPNGEVYIYLFKNIKQNITVIAPTPADAYPVRLVPQLEYRGKDEYSVIWKVRIGENDFKTEAFDY